MRAIATLGFFARFLKGKNTHIGCRDRADTHRGAATGRTLGGRPHTAAIPGHTPLMYTNVFARKKSTKYTHARAHTTHIHFTFTDPHSTLHITLSHYTLHAHIYENSAANTTHAQGHRKRD